MLMAAVLLGVTLVLKQALMCWREEGGAGRPGARRRKAPGSRCRETPSAA